MKNAILKFVIISCAAITCSCQTHTNMPIKAKVWSTTDQPDYYPEQHDKELTVQRLENIRNNPKSFGVAFSGGGTRSASATLGQLRMLHKLGWIDRVHYISAVSGGSWTSVPYTYLPSKHRDQDFLSMDAYMRPSEITNENLAHGKDKVNFSHAIRNSALFVRLLRAWSSRKGDEAYADVLNGIFLKPFGLADRKKLFSWDENSAWQFCHHSNKSGGKFSVSKDFYLARKNRPYLIVGGTLQKKHKALQLHRLPSDIYPLVMTPHYTGVPTRMDVFRHDQPKIGGGFVESAGYDSRSPKHIRFGKDGTARVPLKIRSQRYRFTLSDVMAISGSAPQGPLTGGARYLSFGLASNLGLPEHEHWPILERGAKPYNDDVVHGDGGNLENTGLHALLARRVKNIMVFVNSRQKFDPCIKGFKSELPLWTQINSNGNKNIDGAIQVCFMPSSRKPYNQVFSSRKFEKVFMAFSKIHDENMANHRAGKAGVKPLIYCGTYRVKKNHWHNIEPYDVRVCWIYLYAPPSWAQKIPQDNRGAVHDLKQGRGKFENFPHYNTFLTQGQRAQLIDLSREQVNALANLTSWTLEISEDKIRNEYFPKLKLPKYHSN